MYIAKFFGFLFSRSIYIYFTKFGPFRPINTRYCNESSSPSYKIKKMATPYVRLTFFACLREAILRCQKMSRNCIRRLILNGGLRVHKKFLIIKNPKFIFPDLLIKNYIFPEIFRSLGAIASKLWTRVLV